MTTQMTRLELLTRLNAGEDALDLSIEKWNRLAAFLRAGGDRGDVHIGYSRGALCIEAKAYSISHRLRCIEACRYYAFYDETCYDDEQGPYCELDDELMYETDDVVACMAENMRDQLIKIKEGK